MRRRLARLAVAAALVAAGLVGIAPSGHAGQGSADFNGDGFADLAVGVPEQDVGAIDDAGAVHVLYGSPAGLTAAGDQIWHQDAAGVQGRAEPSDLFGARVVAGNFNGDRFADLAISVPLEEIGSIEHAGAVNVLYGSPAGLTAAGDQLWHQDATGVKGGAEAGDLFGLALAAADFGGDGRADLAVGVSGEDIGSIEDAGAVNVLYGGPAGLTAAGNQLWHQDVAGVDDAAEDFDGFGRALAAADFGGDGRADLAVGVSGEDIGSIENAGAVNVLYGGPAGLTAAGNQLWHQDVAGVDDAAEDFDGFGRALAAADFGGDGRADLAVGVSGEDIGSIEDAGAVNVLYGGPAGLTAAGNQLWHQLVAGAAGSDDAAEDFDGFGRALAAADFGGDGRADLAVGVSGEDIGSIEDAGAVNVLYGGPAGLTAARAQFWHQDVAGVEGVAEVGDGLGSALAAADFGRDGRADLAVGVPDEDIGSNGDAGAVNVLYGSPTGLNAAADEIWHENRAGVQGRAESHERFGQAL